jgi:hypothetical protein
VRHVLGQQLIVHAQQHRVRGRQMSIEIG